MEAIHIGAGIGFRVTESLRFCQNRVERFAAPLHFREDVIAGAVENAGDGDDPVAGDAFAEHGVNRNSARNAGFHGEVDPCANSLIPNLGASQSHELFVGGDDGLAIGNSGFDDLARESRATNEVPRRSAHRD